MLLPNTRRGLQQQDPSPFWSPGLARQKSFQDFLDANQVAMENDFNPTVLPKFDYGLQAAKLGSDTSLLGLNSALNAANNAYLQNSAPVAKKKKKKNDPKVDAYKRALKKEPK